MTPEQLEAVKIKAHLEALRVVVHSVVVGSATTPAAAQAAREHFRKATSRALRGRCEELPPGDV